MTKKGEGLIHTGDIDPHTNRPTRFSAGEEFDCPLESVEIYEERGMAQCVVAAREAAKEDRWWETPSGIALNRTRADRIAEDWPPTDTSVETETRRDGAAIDRDAIARLAARAWRDANTGCLVWQGSKVNGGYGQITYRRTLHRTHRLAWVSHHGPVPANHYVCHSCDNRACIAIEHLFLGTPRENYRDMRSKGRSRYNAKLEFGEVAVIKRRLANGETASEIAKDYPVRYDQILNIKRGLAWREVAPA